LSGLLQVERGTSITVIVTFTYNGAGQDLDNAALPVITLTKPDGTAGPASGTVTNLTGAGTDGQYSFVAPAQAEVTWLDYTAVGTLGGQPQTLRGRVEWLGATLFNLARLRALRVANATPFAASGVTPLFSDAQLMAERTAVLDEFTDALGFSPVPRLAREIHSSTNGYGVQLHQRMQPRLISVSVGGVAQLLAGYGVGATGVLRSVSGYLPGAAIPYGYNNVVVEYVHGWERPRGKGSDMAMLLAAKYLNPSGFSSATTVSTPDGSVYSYDPSESDQHGRIRPTGFRDVDRWLLLHRAVAGVA
jgi:hypothetical protein